MRINIKTIIISVFICLSLNAFSDIIPVFSAERCAWHASDVVLVRLKNDLKGEFEVIDTWKGKLNKGVTIHIPYISNIHQAFEEKDVSNIRKGFYHPGLPDSIDGRRMILFLYGSEKTGWMPAAIDKRINFSQYQEDSILVMRAFMKISVAWIVNNVVYAFKQNMNPGPLEFSGLYYIKNKSYFTTMDKDSWAYYTEKDFKKLVYDLSNIQIHLEKVKEIPGLKERADSTIQFFNLHNSAYEMATSDDVLAILASCGVDALPAMNSLLQDTANKYLPSIILWRYSQIGGAKTEPVLINIVTQELNFRKSKPAMNDFNFINHKTEIMFYALYGLGALPYPGCKDCKKIVREILDFWLANPYLGKQKEINDICTHILNTNQ